MKSLRTFFNEEHNCPTGKKYCSKCQMCVEETCDEKKMKKEEVVDESASILKPRDKKKQGYDGPTQKFEFKQDAKTKKDVEGMKKVKAQRIKRRYQARARKRPPSGGVDVWRAES